jgi:hypothetical protein
VMPLFLVALLITAHADQRENHGTVHRDTTLGVPSAR